MSLSVLLADPDLLYAAGAADALRNVAGLNVGPVVRDEVALYEALKAPLYNVAVIARPLVRDLPALARVALSNECALVLLLGPTETLLAGEASLVNGILQRTADAAHLRACVQSVAAGRTWDTRAMGQPAAAPTPGERVLARLSPRQIRVIAGVARGSKNAEIATVLGTTEQVVKNMLREIYDLTGVSDRLELALFVLHQPELAKAADQATALSVQIPSG